MLKRKIIKELLNWKSNPNHKALLVKGARQVGKTTVIRQFAKQHYDSFVEVNFEQTPQAKTAFQGNLDARTIIMNLSAMGYGPFEKGKTLVFFDEIQSCPQARTAIKFLVEDGSFDWVESGSLLGINYKDVSSYPVGFEHHLNMYPLDFEEFLWAVGISEAVIDEIEHCFNESLHISAFIHNQIMERFRQYLIVGGMPAVVADFVENADINRVVTLQTDILNSYRDDISKYAGANKHIAKSVFDAIPGQLSKQDKRFVISQLEENASQRKYASPTEWLADAGVAYFSFNVRSFELPFPMQEKRNLYKLYLIDTGLMCAMMMGGVQAQVLNGNLEINYGALVENYVASEFVKHGISLDYTDQKSKHELDFIYPNEGKICIIEVKSGKNYKNHASIDFYRAHYSDRISRSIVLCQNNVDIDNDLLYLPLYMSMFLQG